MAFPKCKGRPGCVKENDWLRIECLLMFGLSVEEICQHRAVIQ
jgi:hypothetical protein